MTLAEIGQGCHEITSCSASFIPAFFVVRFAYDPITSSSTNIKAPCITIQQPKLYAEQNSQERHTMGVVSLSTFSFIPTNLSRISPCRVQGSIPADSPFQSHRFKHFRFEIPSESSLFRTTNLSKTQPSGSPPPQSHSFAGSMQVAITPEFAPPNPMRLMA
ncbi:hypothetical protein BJ508DRAFT_312982 [Ascobolus immersus RN42]|uniref:Uncharacterized protein n=1 Tax=Ascobolus immersus RN42 TaxID=1160509 RepID=A0A3N4HR69_ASCIM|nr:hypothetical protein BJ508DRAFT_312982 [Ascobolus immersus RN42]